MPADQLNTPDPQKTAAAVLDVLAGTPLHEAAQRIGMHPAQLATATDVFRHAGTRALEQHHTAVPGWWHLYIEFPHWAAAEATAASHLAPLLDQAIPAWWFIRKHPCWRLRIRLPHSPEDARKSISTALDQLSAAGRVSRWWTGIYEPETAAFGGAAAMEAAHRLFHADSRNILQLNTAPQQHLGRRELSVLLCTAMMHGASLEWYERGDAWQRVAAERPPPSDATETRLRPMVHDLLELLRADLQPGGPLLGESGPGAFAAEWMSAFHTAGRALGTAAREGTLERGLRQILAYHVIFHWNRLGLPARTQSLLATAAHTAVLQSSQSAPSRATRREAQAASSQPQPRSSDRREEQP